jgi:hypothetical protein
MGMGAYHGWRQTTVVQSFTCPNCQAHVVKAERGPETVDHDLACRSCGAPLPGREGDFVLKYPTPGLTLKRKLDVPPPPSSNQFHTEELQIGILDPAVTLSLPRPHRSPSLDHLRAYATPVIRPSMLLAILILALTSLAGKANAGGSCGDMALEIAMSSKLESGGLSKDGTFISLIGDPYSASLYCSGPASMSLRYLGPNPPPKDWYAFVSKTGSVLTKRPHPMIRSAVERCVAEASKSSHVIEIASDGFDVLCGSEKGYPYFELVVTQRPKPPARGRR